MSTLDLIHNRYQILELLGEGGMGRVCRALDLSTGEEVALKTLVAPENAEQGLLLHFKQEFRLMTLLRHPNCCEAYEFGLLPDGHPYFTMELVDGHGLDQLLELSRAPAGPGQAAGLQQAGLTPAKTRELLIQLLLALDAVHQRGLVHRDLKAANVRVRRDGTVKLMDFGLAEYAGRSDAPIKGTLAYLAPEAIKRGPVDLRADLYAVGCLAYELLTGRPPFTGDRPIDVLRAHVEHQAPPPSWHTKGSIDPELEAVVMRLLAKDPLDRYQGAFQVLDAMGYQAPARLGGSLLTSPMMGRTRELEVLQGRLLRLAAGKPGGAVCLYGGSGIGKSRLLEEFRFQAMLESLGVAIGRPYEQGNQPYGLLVEVLRDLLPVLREQVPEALLLAGGAIAKLLPELSAQGIVPAPDLDMASEKLRLQEAVGGLLLAQAQVRPYVVILDDWQWADPLSVELFHAVMVTLAEAPLAFVLASRYPPEGGPAWMNNITGLPLKLLDEDGVKRMINAMLGSPDIAATFLHQVFNLSEGNPFFVERLLEHLVSSGTIRIERGTWHTDVVLGPEVVPRTLQPLLLGKVANLMPHAQYVARVAAVRGREVSLPFLTRVCGLPEDALLEALDELVARRIFDALGGAKFRFAQDHFHEFLAAHLTGEERQALHLAIARALASTWGVRPLEAAPFDMVADVASHAIDAGHAGLTVPFALEAAKRHARLYALGPAERLLKAGLAALTPDASPVVRLEYLQTLGEVRRGLGNMHGAKQAYLEALPLAEQLDRALDVGRLLGALGLVHRMLGSWDEAFAACERALPLLLAGRALGEAVEARLTTSRVHLFQGSVASALADAERALALAREAGEQRIVAEALAHFGHMLITFDPKRYQEGMDCLNETLAILPGLGDKSGLRNAYLLLGSAQSQLGDYPAARICFGRSLALSEEVGSQAGAVGAMINLGLVGLEQGEFAAATSTAQDAYNRAVRLQHTYLMGVSLLVEGVAVAYRGQATQGLGLLDQVLRMAKDLKNAYLEMLALCWQGELQLFLGDVETAMVTTERLGELMTRSGNAEHGCRLQIQRAEILMRQGDKPGAAIAADAALALAVGAHADGEQVRALETKARVALAAEQYLVAGRAADKGLAIAHRIGAAHRAAVLHGILGEVALATGALRAEGHYAAMSQLAAGMGMDVLLAEALFGHAAARPYGEEAAARATEARALLERVAASVTPAAAAKFLAMPERQRILAGNAIDFSLPRTVQRHTGSLIERIQKL